MFQDPEKLVQQKPTPKLIKEKPKIAPPTPGKPPKAVPEDAIYHALFLSNSTTFKRVESSNKKFLQKIEDSPVSKLIAISATSDSGKDKQTGDAPDGGNKAPISITPPMGTPSVSKESTPVPTEKVSSKASSSTKKVIDEEEEKPENVPEPDKEAPKPTPAEPEEVLNISPNIEPTELLYALSGKAGNSITDNFPIKSEVCTAIDLNKDTKSITGDTTRGKQPTDPERKEMKTLCDSLFRRINTASPSHIGKLIELMRSENDASFTPIITQLETYKNDLKSFMENRKEKPTREQLNKTHLTIYNISQSQGAKVLLYDIIRRAGGDVKEADKFLDTMITLNKKKTTGSGQTYQKQDALLRDLRTLIYKESKEKAGKESLDAIKGKAKA